jgi:diguanylate cyclase (GGDEF)-like protein
VVEEQTVEVHEKPRLFRRLAWYRRRVQSLEQQTVIDELTGLRNQRALWRELSRRSGACSASHPLAVLMLDFDLFKEVNEGYGHLVGDAVLRRGASILRSAAASPRLAFRYGGEEFVLLAEAGEDEAVDLAESVRAEIACQNGALPAVTISCGVAELDVPVEPWVALDRADAALREAKRAGRNRVVIAGRTDLGTSPYLVEDLEHETARRAAMALAVATLEVRDTDTAHHSDDVVTLCEALGRRLDLDDHALKHLRAGAQLHDVGKVAVPSSILNKPNALTEHEWAVIREHTIIGERILRSVPEMAEVATIVRHSHEHWDGSGYPDGLAGERIPLASRVILCADAFHAIRADRPYRRGRDAHDAIAEIQACAGTQFDPVVVDAFVDVAAEAHTGKVGGAAGLRKRRLLVLLSTLVIGGGSAVAGNSELRDAIRSVFGATTPPSHATTGTVDGQDFGFGPLGDVLHLPPAQDGKQRGADGNARGSKSAPDGGEHRQHASGDGKAGFGLPGGGGGQSGDGELRGTPAPGPTPTGDTPPESVTGGETPTGEAHGNGRGLALGRDVPVPRRPAQSPRHHKGGRADPPALGHHK